MDHRGRDGTTPEQLLPTDADLIDAIADARRQHVLDVLRERDALDVGELAAVVRRREDLPPTATEDVRLALYHVHLPKLAAADLVQFEPEAETVRFDPPAEIADRLDALFEFTGE